MTLKQRIERERSQLRERMATLAGKGGDMTAEERAELAAAETRLTETEVELRAAIASESDPSEVETRTAPDAEHRERVALRARSHVGRFLAAVVRGQRLDGAEEEYRAAVGAAPGTISFDAFEGREEQRADAATAAPSTIGINMQSVVPAVFSRSIARRRSGLRRSCSRGSRKARGEERRGDSACTGASSRSRGASSTNSA